MTWLLLSTALAQGLEPCATPWLLPDLVGVVPEPAPVPPPAAGKGLRSAYDDVPNVVTSENFALWWGDRGGVSTTKAESLLQVFEDSWDAQLGVLGHDAPEGSDDWLFNVYVGGSGDGTPSDYGAAGYYYRDSQGWPMVVVNTSTVGDPDDYGRSVVAHEFYHALQDRTGAYLYSMAGSFTDGSWFWEATATWVVNEVYPDDEWHAVFLFGYLLVPERPLNAFTYPDGSLDGYHQYGAFLFPRFLTEQAVSPDLIAQVWKDGTTYGDPLDVLAGLLADEGLDLSAMFTEFAANNVRYDYVHGETYQDVVDAYAPYFPGEDHRVAAEVYGDGDRDWEAVDEDLAPARLGYNLVRFEWPDDGDLVVGFDGDGVGDGGSEAAWDLALVIQHSDGDSVVRLDPSEGEWRIEDVDGAEALTLVVAAVPDTAAQDERFAYRWRLSIEQPLPELVESLTPEDDDQTLAAKCGCQTPSPVAGWLGVLVLGILLRRRQADRASG